MRKSLLLVVALLVSLTGFTYADGLSIHITVDENGNGFLTNSAGVNDVLPGTLQNDPGPGGLDNVLTYDLGHPAGLVAGDVLITEDGVLDDVVRFNSPIATLVFYSNPADGGFDSLADTIGPPTEFYPNTITLPEINGEVVYTPTTGQPGSIPNLDGRVTYTLISDPAPVPEPSSLLLLGSGLAGLAGVVRRRLQA